LKARNTKGTNNILSYIDSGGDDDRIDDDLDVTMKINAMTNKTNPMTTLKTTERILMSYTTELHDGRNDSDSIWTHVDKHDIDNKDVLVLKTIGGDRISKSDICLDSSIIDGFDPNCGTHTGSNNDNSSGIDDNDSNNGDVLDTFHSNFITSNEIGRSLCYHTPLESDVYISSSTNNNRNKLNTHQNSKIENEKCMLGNISCNRDIHSCSSDEEKNKKNDKNCKNENEKKGYIGRLAPTPSGYMHGKLFMIMCICFLKSK
jgi:hypothetical protein